MVLAFGEMNLTNFFPMGFFQSVGLLACTTRLPLLLLGRLVQAHLRKGTVEVCKNQKLHTASIREAICQSS